MLFNYCSACASMDLKDLGNGTVLCNKCKHMGKPSASSMDEINALKKSLGRQLGPKPLEAAQNRPSSADELRQKLKSLKGKTSSDSEIL